MVNGRFGTAALGLLLIAACGQDGSDSPTSEHLRGAGATTLSAALEFTQGGDDSLATLQMALGDEDWMARAQAATILGRLGDPAIEFLGPATTDVNEAVRVNALAALHSISGSGTVTWLIAALDDPSARVRIRALRALSEAGALSRAQAARVVDLFNAPSQKERRWASLVAVAAGPAAVAPLAAALDAGDDERWRVAWALGQIGPRAAEALPRLRELTSSTAPRMATEAAAAISAIETDL